jgi:hypothetical protein
MGANTDAHKSLREAPVALNSAQLSHYRQLCLHPEQPTTLMVQYRISGLLNVGGFVSALSDCIQTHDALRVRIVPEAYANKPGQLLRPVPAARELVDCKEVTCQSEDAFARYVGALLRADIFHPWHLEDDYPFRFRLLRYTRDIHAFLATFCHVAIDGRGVALFALDLWDFYEKRLANITSAPADSESDLVPVAGTKLPVVANDNSTIAFWRERARTLPPAFQFNTVRHPLKSGRGPDPAVLRLEDDELSQLLLSAKRARCTPFQWSLSAFAAVLFDSTAQDLVSVVIPFDLRSFAERSTVGMFVLRLPMRLERDTATPGGLLKQVKDETVSLLRHRFVAPHTLDEVYAASASRWGTQWAVDIKATNAEHWSQKQREVRIGNMVAREGYYQPRLEYTSVGIDFLVVTGVAFHELRLCFRAEYFSEVDAVAFVGALKDRLVDVESHVCPPIKHPSCARTVADAQVPPALVPLHDPDGRIVMWCDLNATQDMIQRHPAVTSAKVGVEQDEDGGDCISAGITVSEHLDETVLRDELLAASDRYVLAPKNLYIFAQ